MNAIAAVETVVARGLLDLPEKVQRVLAGRPVTIDGQTLATDLQVMLRAQRLVRRSDLGAAQVEQGRAAMRANAALVGGAPPIGEVRDLAVADRPARLYRPRAAAQRPGDSGLLIFFHGGGFIYGDLASHDAPCRFLAERSGVPVLSVEYAIGPENAFPAAFDDALEAVRWTVKNAADLGVDAARIGVGGDSAGGNLAAWAAIAAAREGIELAFQLLVYPCVDADRETASLRLFSDGFYLTAEGINLINDTYLPTPENRQDERVNLLEIDLPSGLAPAHVVTAGFDPLRDEGEAYARRLGDAGVVIELRRYVDQIHGFLNIVGAGRSSRAAVAEIAASLRSALG